MKTLSIIGILLIVLGIAAFAYQGITHTSQDEVVDIGPLQMSAENTQTMPLTPILGAIALAGGIVFLVVGKKSA